MIKSIFSFLCELLKGIFMIQSEKNAPDVKQAAKAQQEIGQEEKEEKHIAERNIDEIRKDLSE